MPFGIGTGELVILLVVLLLVFGAKRLPEMGRSLGKGMREFKEGVAGGNEPPVDEAATTPPARELPSASSELDSEESPAETERQTVR
jgi:sec-independent protein translocase protein TatA